MLQERLQPHPDVERRAVGRTKIDRDVLMCISGQDGVHACCVRDVTNHGAGLRLNGLIMVPSEFGISFDNFRTMRRCRLIWRDGDFVGAPFQRGEQCRLRSQGSHVLCCGCWRWHAAEPACICWAGLNRILF